MRPIPRMARGDAGAFEYFRQDEAARPRVTAGTDLAGEAFVTPAWCVLMARYNAWQNDVAVTAAGGLDASARQADRGAFFGSISRTFSHLLWGDLIWLSRFDGGAPPGGGISGSGDFCTDWEAFRVLRSETDLRVRGWAGGLTADALKGNLDWYSGALKVQMSRPLGLCIAHFFNHQTHHRGQIHAMLTMAGAVTCDSDLFAMPGRDAS